MTGGADAMKATMSGSDLPAVGQDPTAGVERSHLQDGRGLVLGGEHRLPTLHQLVARAVATIQVIKRLCRNLLRPRARGQHALLHRTRCGGRTRRHPATHRGAPGLDAMTQDALSSSRPRDPGRRLLAAARHARTTRWPPAYGAARRAPFPINGDHRGPQSLRPDLHAGLGGDVDRGRASLLAAMAGTAFSSGAVPTRTTCDGRRIGRWHLAGPARRSVRPEGIPDGARAMITPTRPFDILGRRRASQHLNVQPPGRGPEPTVDTGERPDTGRGP